MYLWRKTAELHWVEAHEDLLQAHAHGQLVIVQRPGRKRLELEIACARGAIRLRCSRNLAAESRHCRAIGWSDLRVPIRSQSRSGND